MSFWTTESPQLRKGASLGAILLFAVLALVLTAGCSSTKGSENSLDYEPQSRSTEAVKTEVSGISSQIFDVMDIKIKVTEPGPNVQPCDTGDGDTGKLLRIRHPWSAYGVGNDVMEKGMANLRQGLPEQGWKIEKVGDDGSKNKNMQILAVHKKTFSQAEITWLKGLDGHEPLIEVNLYSRCFRPAGGSE
ncbi:hypothetical protein QFZ66_003647 [Streptomyces sp. B4I13]|uniref:hypothetical protein n=1 Tax=Streptomyces sp. B4I13 TaxID=3042271 RepID=UPI0027851039|nr:hypothetical protein [Streptomyces sp. B4I13]MDQ0959769.1 hypothetical protein [Streptomyces sp. B4I13]